MAALARQGLWVVTGKRAVEDCASSSTARSLDGAGSGFAAPIHELRQKTCAGSGASCDRHDAHGWIRLRRRWKLQGPNSKPGESRHQPERVSFPGPITFSKPSSLAEPITCSEPILVCR